MLFFVSIACVSAICGLLDDFHTRYVVLGRDLEDQVVTESTRTQRLMFPRVPPARSGDAVEWSAVVDTSKGFNSLNGGGG